MANPPTAGANLLDASLRRIVATARTPFRPYDRYGAARDDMEYLPLGDESDGAPEIFVLKFKPGAASTAHEHTGGEAFYVLEGGLTDCDGAAFGVGDYVRYRPGSRHFSVSATGCTLLVMLFGRNLPTAAPHE
ncbi:MAG: cupin domain-containing protein [bacterium]